jgi:hypothetical protein
MVVRFVLVCTRLSIHPSISLLTLGLPCHFKADPLVERLVLFAISFTCRIVSVAKWDIGLGWTSETNGVDTYGMVAVLQGSQVRQNVLGTWDASSII